MDIFSDIDTKWSRKNISDYRIIKKEEIWKKVEYETKNELLNRLCRPWQRRYRRGSFVEQLHQPDKAFVTVCAMLNASTRIVVSGTNRAKPCGRGFTGYAYVLRSRCRAHVLSKA